MLLRFDASFFEGFEFLALREQASGQVFGKTQQTTMEPTFGITPSQETCYLVAGRDSIVYLRRQRVLPKAMEIWGFKGPGGS